MKVIFSFNALRRLRKIRDYFRRKGNAAKGNRVANEIIDRALELEKNPRLGPEEENLKELGLGHRSLLVGKLYKVVYRVFKKDINVTDVFDVRQDPDSMKP